MRLGFGLKKHLNDLRPGQVVWLHAVSVGEVLSILPFIDQLIERYPRCFFVCTTVTKTGYLLAQDKLKSKAVVLFAPIDLSWVVNTYIHVIRPRLYIAAETEIWPNLFRCLHRYQVPIMIINGRISDSAFKGYSRFESFFKKALSVVGLYCMQSPLDAERIIKLGARPEGVEVVGNLKFELAATPEKLTLTDIGCQSGNQLLIAGSTHPGEELILIQTYKKLLVDFPHLRLILAPRHVERTQDVEKIIQSCCFEPVRLSRVKGRVVRESQILLVDAMGYLRDLYRLATVVFVGKTLTGVGGQNMIEPAFYGKATLVGPHTENFKDVMRIFLENEIIRQVDNEETLFDDIKLLLTDNNLRQSLGRKAKKVVAENRGAGLRTLGHIEKMLAINP